MDTTNNQGVVFADHQHRTIFADNGLQKMLSIPKGRLEEFIGEPVHKLFGISSQTYNEIIKESQPKLDNIELHDKSGKSVLVNLDYTVSKDAQDKLMGIDFTVRQSLGHVESDEALASIPDEMLEEVIRFYFKRQIESLFEVMSQIGGYGLWQYIEDAINESADKNGWAIAINGQDINIKTVSLPIDAYQGLLFKAATYSAKAIGKHLVKKVVDKVDQQSNSIVFEHIAKDWFEQLG